MKTTSKTKATLPPVRDDVVGRAARHQRVPGDLFRSRLSVATIFFINGAVHANWVTRIPAIQDRLGANNAELGLALGGMPVGLAVGVPLAAWLINRWTSSAVTWVGAVVYCLTLPFIALAPRIPLLLAALLATGIAAAAVDVAMNTDAAVVARGYRRPIMSSFHGLFSLGGLIGAAIGGSIAGLGVAPTPHLTGIALALGLVALVVGRWLSRVDPTEISSAPAFAWPDRSLITLGLVGFCVLLGEGAIADWSAVYLRRVVETGPGFAAAGFAAFSLMMALGRLTGDRFTARIGARRFAQLGGLLTILGMLLVLLPTGAVGAVVGFALVGAGLSNVFPLVVGAASRSTRMASGSAIAAVTSLGYFGFLVGPTVIGLVAELFGLRSALGIVALMGLLIIGLARGIAPARIV